MAENKNQEQWLYDLIGKKYTFANGATVKKLSDDERREIEDKMKRYWKNHDNESTEFLVNGALLKCDKSGQWVRFNSNPHNVYTDGTETKALANIDDKAINGNFGYCSVVTRMLRKALPIVLAEEKLRSQKSLGFKKTLIKTTKTAYAEELKKMPEPVQKKAREIAKEIVKDISSTELWETIYPGTTNMPSIDTLIDNYITKHNNSTCLYTPVKWSNVRNNVLSDGRATLDTNSFLTCQYGGIITPITSGQEFTLGNVYTQYPKFLNDDGTINEVIVKKLMLRNISHMKQNEIDALIKLGIYLCVCEDVGVIKKIINCGYLDSKITYIHQSGIHQHTLLDNFIYVSGWTNAYARMCCLRNKVYISSKPLWNALASPCTSLKKFVEIRGVEKGSSVSDNKHQTAFVKQFLNVKLLETVLLAGDIYNDITYAISDLKKLVEEVKGIHTYVLMYKDGDMSDYSNNSIKMSMQFFYIFAGANNDSGDSYTYFEDKAHNSIKSKTDVFTTTVTYGTSFLSLLLALPSIAILPYAGALGAICTVVGIGTGMVDATNMEKQFISDKQLYLEEKTLVSVILEISRSMLMYTAITLRVTESPAHSSGSWKLYKQHYSTSEKGQKAREAGYLTEDTRNTSNEYFSKLGGGYSYNISVFGSYLTKERLDNFNDNMQHIKVWNKEKDKYITIPENEGFI